MFGIFKKEFKFKKFGFKHDPVDSMVRSQWQTEPRSYFYLAYRWIVAVFFIVAMIISFHTHLQRARFGLYFIYITRWSLLVNTIVGIFGAILVTVWHFNAYCHGLSLQRYFQLNTKFVIQYANFPFQTNFRKPMKCHLFLKFIGFSIISHWLCRLL